MNILLWIVFAYWAVNLVQTICNLVFIRRIRPVALGREPFVSVIVPARDEEAAIERTARALLAQLYSSFEVIVVDDRSTDATPDILRKIAAEDPRLVVVTGEEPPAGWLGKPWALHQGSLRARGELLLFVDADIHYAPATLNAAVAAIERTGRAMLCLFTRLEMQGVWENAAMPQLTMMGFSHSPTWLGDRMSITPMAIGAGAGNLIRRGEYETVGGHVALRSAIIDDIGLARHVRANGHRTALVRADHLISVRMYHGLGETVRGFTKNAFTTIERSYALAAAAIVLMLLMHLLPFAMALAGNLIAIAAVGLIVATRIVLFSGMGYPLWSAILLQPVQTFLWIWIVLRSAWFTGIRGQVVWRGRTYDAAHTRFGADR